MLTCPPSRINLTVSDIAGFERRHAAKQMNRQPRTKDAGLKVWRGPEHLTQLGFVPAEANLGHKRAESCSSRATICTDQDESNERITKQALGIRGIKSSTSSHNASGSVEYPSSLYGASEVQHVTYSRPERPAKPTRQLEGIPPLHSRSPRGSPQSHHFDINGDPVELQAYIEARHIARRRLREREIQHAPPPVPELEVSATVTQSPHDFPGETDPSQPMLNLTLDPGAPVFVPRTRFASATSISLESGTGGAAIDSSTTNGLHSQTEAYLRIRSSFERNSQHSSSGQQRQTIATDPTLATERSETARIRRRSRTNDQNTTLPAPISGVDRYPALRPPTTSAGAGRGSGLHRQVVFPRRQSSRQHILDYERSRRSGDETAQHAALAMPLGTLRPVSPAVSAISRSTPNLLHGPTAPSTLARSSSLSWRENAVENVKAAHAARVVSGAGPVTDASSALEEYLLNTESPLDALASQMSRLSARPRSVGRSFEQALRSNARPSLLAGDPFRLSPCLIAQAPWPTEQDVSISPEDHVCSSREPADLPSQSPRKHQAQSRSSSISESAPEDPIAVAQALSPLRLPSSPPTKLSPQASNTPITQGRCAASPEPPTSRSPTSPPPTQPLAEALRPATPKVCIYNDNKPPAIQPQTPADLSFATGRARLFSNTAVSASQSLPPPAAAATPGFTQGHATAVALPPDRHPHRHTYPSAVTATTREQQQQQTNPPGQASFSPIQQTTAATAASRHSARIDRQRGSDTLRDPTRDPVRDTARTSFGHSSVENELEASLPGLEADLRV